MLTVAENVWPFGGSAELLSFHIAGNRLRLRARHAWPPMEGGDDGRQFVGDSGVRMANFCRMLLEEMIGYRDTNIGGWVRVLDRDPFEDV